MRHSRSTLVLLSFLLFLPGTVRAQFTPEEIVQREKWEEFLRKARIIKSTQLERKEGVTLPWVLTLEKDGIVRKALWKNIKGHHGGYQEHWHWEIAAYRLDKHLGLNMVPPTVQRRFWRQVGSCQLWVESEMSLREKNQRNIPIPQDRLRAWHRAMCKQRTFDNLIANEDRHQGNYLITSDWRIILIDHSRTFRSKGRFVENLIYCENHPDGPLIMREVPRALYEKIRSLDDGILKEVGGKYLTKEERGAILARKDLIIKEIERLSQKYGAVLYDPDPLRD